MKKFTGKTLKKICISFGIIFIILLTISCAWACGVKKENTEYLRIHVRANSNSDEDQRVKYLVRDAIVEKLTPLVAECETKRAAIEMLTREKDGPENLADAVLVSNNFAYKSKIEIKNEEFPTRVYDGETLESGYYDAIIVSLGEAKGDNWWCVVYPPLCFSTDKPVYRSKIAEIIGNFRRKRG